MIETILIITVFCIFIAAMRALFLGNKDSIGINYVNNTTQTEPMTNFITTIPPNAHIPTKTKNQRQKRKLKKQMNKH